MAAATVAGKRSALGGTGAPYASVTKKLSNKSAAKTN